MQRSNANTTFEIVSPEQRRDNSRAVAQRDKWRRQYGAVARTIKSLKGKVRTSTSGVEDLKVQLRIMQFEATALMYLREQIKYDLRTTSYRYVPKAWLEQAAQQQVA